jgi:hypothetical protein
VDKKKVNIFVSQHFFNHGVGFIVFLSCILSLYSSYLSIEQSSKLEDLDILKDEIKQNLKYHKQIVQFDFAAEVNGGKIIETHRQSKDNCKIATFFGISLFFKKMVPSTVLIRVRINKIMNIFIYFFFK